MAHYPLQPGLLHDSAALPLIPTLEDPIDMDEDLVDPAVHGLLGTGPGGVDFIQKLFEQEPAEMQVVPKLPGRVPVEGLQRLPAGTGPEPESDIGHAQVVLLPGHDHVTDSLSDYMQVSLRCVEDLSILIEITVSGNHIADFRTDLFVLLYHISVAGNDLPGLQELHPGQLQQWVVYIIEVIPLPPLSLIPLHSSPIDGGALYGPPPHLCRL